jgi:hypothetical protein
MEVSMNSFLRASAFGCLLAALACSSDDNDNGGKGACAQLAEKCPHCTEANLKATCEAAVNSGDPGSCRNGLDDPDIQSMCVPTGSGGSGGSSGAGGTSTGGGAGLGGASGFGGVGGSGGGPCAELASKCPKCTELTLKLTCEAAVASGDPASCQNGLDDPDVQTMCK